MVAAWIRADTGVGPSIASSNQLCSGTCADLPQAASSRSRPSAVATLSDASGMPAATPSNEVLPNVLNINMMASAIPMSPTRFTTNAFLAATAAESLCCQNPISRYDARPTPSQPRNRVR